MPRRARVKRRPAGRRWKPSLMHDTNEHALATQPHSAGELRGPDEEKIRAMFSRVAPRYDLANTVLSAGIHHAWRRRLVRWSGARPGMHVLDCATGTGDLAIAFKKAVGKDGHVVGTDFSPEMLAPAPAKAAALGLEIEFAQADVTKLPYESATFDIASISFGIRNVQRPGLGIAELARVVRPGGTVMVLEFGQPSIPVWRGVFSLYSRVVLPRIGGAITGEGAAYRYLQDSSAHFPCGRAFAQFMQESAAFSSVEYRTLSGGIAYLYKAIRR